MPDQLDAEELAVLVEDQGEHAGQGRQAAEDAAPRQAGEVGECTQGDDGEHAGRAGEVGVEHGAGDQQDAEPRRSDRDQPVKWIENGDEEDEPVSEE